VQAAKRVRAARQQRREPEFGAGAYLSQLALNEDKVRKPRILHVAHVHCVIDVAERIHVAPLRATRAFVRQRALLARLGTRMEVEPHLKILLNRGREAA
jgi:hypothetical protein